MDAIVTDLSATVAAFTDDDSPASSVLGGVTAAVKKLDERLRVVTGGMEVSLISWPLLAGNWGRILFGRKSSMAW